MKNKGFAFTTFTITALTILMLAMLATIQIVDNPRISSETQQINEQTLITQQINQNYQTHQKKALQKITRHINDTDTSYHNPDERLNNTYADEFGDTEKGDLRSLLENTEDPDVEDTDQIHESYSVKTSEGYEDQINNTIQKTSQKYTTSININNQNPSFELDDESEPETLITTTKITTKTAGTVLNTQINQTQEITTETDIPK